MQGDVAGSALAGRTARARRARRSDDTSIWPELMAVQLVAVHAAPAAGTHSAPPRSGWYSSSACSSHCAGAMKANGLASSTTSASSQRAARATSSASLMISHFDHTKLVQ